MKNRIYACLLLCLAALLILCVPVSAPAETQAELADAVTYNAGRTTISWTVTGTDSGTWYVMGRVVENGKSEQQRFLIGTTGAHQIEAVSMIPGKKYEIELVDENFITRATKVYQMPKAKKFKDSMLKSKSIMIRITPVKQSGSGDPKQTKALKADTIAKAAAGDGTRYGVKYHIRMPQLVKTRAFFVTIAFESPDGFVKTVHAGDITFKKVSNGYQTLWFNMIGDDFFTDLYTTTNQIDRKKTAEMNILFITK